MGYRDSAKAVDVDDIVKEATRSLKAANTPTTLEVDDEVSLSVFAVLSINILSSWRGIIFKLPK